MRLSPVTPLASALDFCMHGDFEGVIGCDVQTDVLLDQIRTCSAKKILEMIIQQIILSPCDESGNGLMFGHYRMRNFSKQRAGRKRCYV